MDKAEPLEFGELLRRVEQIKCITSTPILVGFPVVKEVEKRNSDIRGLSG